VVVRRKRPRIEVHDGLAPLDVAVHPGMAEWGAPTEIVHRAVNVGTVPYEEVVLFFLDAPGKDPQPSFGT
jgi:hypothetical protein